MAEIYEVYEGFGEGGLQGGEGLQEGAAEGYNMRTLVHLYFRTRLDSACPSLYSLSAFPLLCLPI